MLSKPLNSTYSLYDEKSFFSAFLSDLSRAKSEVIIESPFITTARMKTYFNSLRKLIDKDIKIYVITRDPREHKADMAMQSEETIRWFEEVGIQTLLCSGNDHRKLAIIDRQILWEGSLNILSQTKSREIMRRMDGGNVAKDTFEFLRLGRFIE